MFFNVLTSSGYIWTMWPSLDDEVCDPYNLQKELIERSQPCRDGDFTCEPHIRNWGLKDWKYFMESQKSSNPIDPVSKNSSNPIDPVSKSSSNPIDPEISANVSDTSKYDPEIFGDFSPTSRFHAEISTDVWIPYIDHRFWNFEYVSGRQFYGFYGFPRVSASDDFNILRYRVLWGESFWVSFYESYYDFMFTKIILFLILVFLISFLILFCVLFVKNNTGYKRFILLLISLISLIILCLIMLKYYYNSLKGEHFNIYPAIPCYKGYYYPIYSDNFVISPSIIIIQLFILLIFLCVLVLMYVQSTDDNYNVGTPLIMFFCLLVVVHCFMLQIYLLFICF